MLDGAPIEPLLLFLLALQSCPCTFPVYHGQPAQTGLISGYNGGSSQTLGLVSDSFCSAARVKVQVCVILCHGGNLILTERETSLSYRETSELGRFRQLCSIYLYHYAFSAL